MGGTGGKEGGGPRGKEVRTWRRRRCERAEEEEKK